VSEKSVVTFPDDLRWWAEHGWFDVGEFTVRKRLREAADRIEELVKDRDSWRGAAYSWKKIADPINDKNIEAMFGRTQTALDAQINNPTQADKVRDAQVVVGDGNKPTYHNLRSCPNAVSWCEGPDRYAGICNACLATWAEETRGTMPVAENPPV
jgi:hypothetical protein